MDDALEAAPQTPQSEPLYLVCTIYTWTLLTLNVIELFTGISSPDRSLSLAYFAILAGYGGSREVGKWRKPEPEQAEHQRRGERFVVAWGLLLAAAVFLAYFVRGFHLGAVQVTFHFPHELLAIALQVLAVLTGTKISRSYRTGEPLLGMGRRRAPAGMKHEPRTAAATTSEGDAARRFSNAAGATACPAAVDAACRSRYGCDRSSGGGLRDRSSGKRG